MLIRHILAAAPAAIALSFGFAGSASAATIVSLPCVATYVGNLEPSVPLTGTGFTPGGSVTIAYVHPKKSEPEITKTVTADAAGSIADIAYPAGYTSFDTQDQTFTLVARDNTNPAIIATTTLRQVRAGFDISPNPTKPTSRVTYTARGWTVGRNVYAHFRFKAKTWRSVSLGKAEGPCGIARRKMRALPTRAFYGLWTVFIDQQRRYSPSTRPQAKDSFTIFRKFT